jgi:hypothetical protein
MMYLTTRMRATTVWVLRGNVSQHVENFRVLRNHNCKRVRKNLLMDVIITNWMQFASYFCGNNFDIIPPIYLFHWGFPTRRLWLFWNLNFNNEIKKLPFAPTIWSILEGRCIFSISLLKDNRHNRKYCPLKLERSILFTACVVEKRGTRRFKTFRLVMKYY